MTFLSLFLFLFTTPALSSLSPLIVKESALKYHPTVRAALERVRAQEFAVIGANGAFDAKIVSDYRAQTKYDWNTSVSRSQIEKPIPLANSKIYAGTEQISSKTGKLAPIYNTSNPSTTGQAGNYSLIGLKLSLWKNLSLDPNRAALKNAKYNASIAQGEKRLANLDIGRLGQLAYWEWVTAQKVKNVYEELLKNGEKRNEYLISRNSKGDIAKILITENEQYIANRRGSLQAAKERLLRAELTLSLFYRDTDARPIVPSSNESFEDYPNKLALLIEKLDLNSNIEDLMEKRPDLANLSLQIEKTNVDLELAQQDLKPQIDLATEYFQRTAVQPGMPSDYLMLLAQVSIPLERNLGNGNISAAHARKMVAQSEMNLARQIYKLEVMALRQSLHLRLEQVAQAEIEFTKAKELVESETYKFKSGGGNLYLVNLREEAQARAEASFNEARLGFMDGLLTYEALVNVDE
jgi:outer membrane protein TolC